MMLSSNNEASGGSQVNLESDEAQAVLDQLRESIAQDLTGLSVHLYVLSGEAQGTALARRLADLQRVAARALDETIAVASFIELATKRNGARRKRSQDVGLSGMEALRHGNERLSQLAARLALSAGGHPASQAGSEERRPRASVDGGSSG